MTAQEKFEKWRQDYRLRTYDDNTYLYEDQLAAYLAAAKEAREETIRECADIAREQYDWRHDTGTNNTSITICNAILALLEKK